uniref:Uncharacterized protein n=1 Tax=Cacopsylla melanoneura TaxID=428564 RepID=A0A8D8ZG45_9HEMI
MSTPLSWMPWISIRWECRPSNGCHGYHSCLPVSPPPVGTLYSVYSLRSAKCILKQCSYLLEPCTSHSRSNKERGTRLPNRVENQSFLHPRPTRRACPLFINSSNILKVNLVPPPHKMHPNQE